MSSFTANFHGLELHSSRLRKVNVIPYAQTKAKRFQDFVQMYFVRIEWQNSKSKATVLSKQHWAAYTPIFVLFKLQCKYYLHNLNKNVFFLRSRRLIPKIRLTFIIDFKNTKVTPAPLVFKRCLM